MKSTWEQYAGRSLEEIVAAHEAHDPEGFSTLNSMQKRFVAGYLEGLALETQKSRGLGWRMNDDCRRLLASQGQLAEQVDASYLQRMRAEAMGSADRVAEASAIQREIADLERKVETNTTSDIATIQRAIAYVVTRMQTESWVPAVLPQMTMTSVSMHIGIEDMLTDDGAGHAYATGSTLWDNEDPDFGDRSSCTDDAALIKMRIQGDTLTATAKLVGAKICIQAVKDARDGWGRDPLTALPQTITWELWREVYREIANSWITSAGTQGNWSSTATGVYVTLDPRVYLRTLDDTVLDVCATIENTHGQRPDWRAMKPDVWNRFTKMGLYEPKPTPALTNTPAEAAHASNNAGMSWGTEVAFRDLHMIANKVLVGISRFKTRGNMDQLPSLLGVYPGSDRVEMLYTPTTTILEMAQLLQTAFKLLIATAYGTVTIA